MIPSRGNFVNKQNKTLYLKYKYTHKKIWEPVIIPKQEFILYWFSEIYLELQYTARESTKFNKHAVGVIFTSNKIFK